MKKLKAAICSLFLLCTLFLNSSYAFTSIGAPVAEKASEEGSQVLLLRMKVVECFQSALEAELAYDHHVKLTRHDACGDGYAHVLMNLKESARSGNDHTFKEDEKIPYVIYQPKVYVEKGHFIVKPSMEKQMTTSQSQIILSLSKIIHDHVKATLAVDVDKVTLKDNVAHYKGDQTYVNQTPIHSKRVMTTSETFKIGERKILSGDMWLEGVKKVEGVLPEYSRLWLDISIK